MIESLEKLYIWCPLCTNVAERCSQNGSEWQKWSLGFEDPMYSLNYGDLKWSDNSSSKMHIEKVVLWLLPFTKRCGLPLWSHRDVSLPLDSWDCSDGINTSLGASVETKKVSTGSWGTLLGTFGISTEAIGAQTGVNVNRGCLYSISWTAVATRWVRSSCVMVIITPWLFLSCGVMIFHNYFSVIHRNNLAQSSSRWH